MKAHPVPTRNLAVFLGLALITPPVCAACPRERAVRWQKFAPYFRVSAGYASTIIVSHRHMRASATVTPIVYTPNGAELRLPSVHSLGPIKTTGRAACRRQEMKQHAVA